MPLENICFVSPIVAVVATVLSLLFVGAQIHRNANATKAASHGAVSAALNEINRLFAENADVTKIWLAGAAKQEPAA